MKKRFELKQGLKNGSQKPQKSKTPSQKKEVYSRKQIITELLGGALEAFSPARSFSENADSPWQALSSIKEFQFLFPKKGEKPWTLLKKIGGDFIKTSPWGREGIQTLLKLGLISDQDFIWKEGFSAWERISLCPHFKTRFDDTAEDLMDRAFTQYKKSDSVFIFKKGYEENQN